MGSKLAEIARARQRMHVTGMRQANEITMKLFCVNCPKVLGASTRRYFAAADGRGDSQEIELLGVKPGVERINDWVYVCPDCARVPGLVEKLRNPDTGHSEESELISTT